MHMAVAIKEVGAMRRSAPARVRGRRGGGDAYIRNKSAFPELTLRIKPPRPRNDTVKAKRDNTMSVLTYVAKPIAYVSVPMYILSKLAEALPSARYYIRLGLFLSGLGICSIWGALCGVGMSLIGQRFNSPWVTARTFYALSRRLLDIRIEVEGEEHLENRPAIIISNHQSMLDIVMLGRYVDWLLVANLCRSIDMFRLTQSLPTTSFHLSQERVAVDSWTRSIHASRWCHLR